MNPNVTITATTDDNLAHLIEQAAAARANKPCLVCGGSVPEVKVSTQGVILGGGGLVVALAVTFVVCAFRNTRGLRTETRDAAANDRMRATAAAARAARV
ncbi:MAG: hypothetical protein KIH64_015030 [Mycobacterium sp.]|nr:hypothetical protein [Mycobacterium sp.]